jgi:hypothetical protein
LIPSYLGQLIGSTTQNQADMRDYNEALRRSQDYARQSLDTLSGLGSLKMPDPVRPAFRTEDAIKLVLGALLSGGGNELPEFLAGYMGAKEQRAAQDTQAAQNRFEQEVRLEQSKANRLGGLADLERQTANDLMSQINRRETLKQQGFQAAQNRYLRQQQLEADQENRMLNRKMQYVNLMQKASRPEQFEFLAKQAAAQGVVIPEAEKEILQDEVKALWASKASEEWEKIKKGLYTSIGMPSAADIERMETQRLNIAKRFGIDPQELLDISGTTPLRQQNWQKEFDQKGKYQDKQFDIFQKRIDNEAKRIAVAYDRLAYDRAKYGNDVAQENYKVAMQDIGRNLENELAPLKSQLNTRDKTVKDKSAEVEKLQNRYNEAITMKRSDSDIKGLEKLLKEKQYELSIARVHREGTMYLINQAKESANKAMSVIKPEPVVLPPMTSGTIQSKPSSLPKSYGNIQPLPGVIGGPVTGPITPFKLPQPPNAPKAPSAPKKSGAKVNITGIRVVGG